MRNGIPPDSGEALTTIGGRTLFTWVKKNEPMRINKKDFLRARVKRKITPGEMLKTLRELQGLTQKELAEKTGVGQPNISAMESNSRNIGRERALILAKALRVHPAVILFPDFDIATVA